MIEDDNGGTIGDLLEKKKKERRERWGRRAKTSAKVLGLGTLLSGVVGSCALVTELQTGYAEGIVASFSDKTIEGIDVLIDEQYEGLLPDGQNIIVHDREGEVIAETYNLRDRVTQDDISRHVGWAFVAAEDRRFYDHHGWDWAILMEIPKVILTASLSNVRGHSSISVQVADLIDGINIYDLNSGSEKLEVKMDEWAAAAVLERNMTKDEILVEYMNLTNFGYSHREGMDIIGVDAAAEFYFGKEPGELDYLESAVLASMVQNSAKMGVLAYDAFVFDKDPTDDHFVRLRERTRYVLKKMHELNYGRDEEVIPDREYQKALDRLDANDIPFKMNSRRRIDPEVYGFVSEVLGRVPGFLAEFDHLIPEGSDIHVYTGLDSALQLMLQEKVDEQCDALNASITNSDGTKKKRYRGNSFNGASLVLDTNTHEILAMVDGCSVYVEEDGQQVRIANRVNRTTREFWHPGSSIKGIIDILALQFGFTTETKIADKKRVYVVEESGVKYSVGNFGNSYSGALYTLKEATVKSTNSIFVEVLSQIYKALGKERFLTEFNKFGFTLDDYQYPYGIGAFEASLSQVAGAYSVIPNNGQATHYIYGDHDDINQSYINHLVIDDEYTITPEGTTVEIVDPSITKEVDEMLQAVVSRGTGQRAKVPGMTPRGKTGTATANVVFVGYEPTYNILGIAEFGLENPGISLPKQYQGGRHAAPIVKSVFEYTK